MATNSTYSAGSLKSVTLKNSLTPSNGIDITDLTTELQIYQAIDVPFMTGKLLIVDGVSLLDNIMLFGNEQIDVVFEARDPSGQLAKVKCTFISTSIERLQRQENNNVYLLTLGSKHLIGNLNTRLAQAYSGKSSDIVKEILTKELNVAEKDLDVEDTMDNKKVVIPNLRIADALMWITRRAYSKSGTPCFVYEYLDGSMAFRSLEKMYARKPIITYTRSATKSSDPYSTYSNIIELQFDSVGNGYTNVSEGMFAAKVYAFDMLTKQVIEEDFNLNDYETQSTLLNDAVADPGFKIGGKSVYEIPEAKVYHIFTSSDGSNNTNPEKTSVNDMIGDYHTNAEYRVPYMNSKLLQLENFTITITVQGNPNLFPGGIVEVIFPSTSAMSKGMTKRNDYYYSGKYLITGIKHSFTSQNYISHVQLAKDSVLIAST